MITSVKCPRFAYFELGLNGVSDEQTRALYDALRLANIHGTGSKSLGVASTMVGRVTAKLSPSHYRIDVDRIDHLALVDATPQFASIKRAMEKYPPR